MKMKHLLSFLTLLVLGWGQAWGITSVTYPHTWDFTKWDSSISWGRPWELATDDTGTYYHTSNFVRSNYDGELTDKASNSSGYQILQETAGLKFFAGNERCRIYMDGQGIGLSIRSGYTPTITVPGLRYGQSVKITMGPLLSTSGFHPGSAKVTFPDGTENTRAMDNTYIYDIPSDVTTATDQVFTFNATSEEYVTIKKIEVVANLETSFRYGVCDAYNNGSTTNSRTGLDWKTNGNSDVIQYSDTQIGVAFSLRGLINNGVTLADLCGVSSADEVTNDLIAQYFTVTSSDNNVLDASSSTVTKHSTTNYFNVTNVKPMNCGTATLTIVYKGNDIYKPLTYRNTLTINGQAGPRIVWVTALRGWVNPPTDDFEGEANTFQNTVLGGTYRKYYMNFCGPFGNGETRCVDTGVDNIFTKYNDNANYQAYVLAPGATVPSWWHKMSIGKDNAECYYYVCQDYSTYDGPEDYMTLKFSDSDIRTYNTRKVEREGDVLGWREYKTDWRPYADPNASTLFYNGDPTMAAIQYSTSGTSDQVSTVVRTNTGNNDLGGKSKYINVTFRQPMRDSLEIYAQVPVAAGVNPAKSTVKILVADGVLNFQFQPQEVNVMEGAWIMPYVLLPDVPLRDFQRIYVTLDDGTIANVDDADKLYENLNGADVDNMTNAELDALCGEYISWKRVEAVTHKVWSDEANDSVTVIDVPSYIAITAIRPKIWGVTPDQSTYVRIHIESDQWADTGAAIKVNVIGRMADLFHWEMNDNDEGHDDKIIKTIYISEDDFIYMPGIVGNPNGNTDYSAKESYKYAYTIKKGTFTMNNAPYFYREGVPNYFFTKSYTSSTESYSGYAPSGTRLIPTNNTTTTDANTEAVIFWATGLGGYYRNDSLMIYANNQTTTDLYLWAEDAQTGVCCTPIKVVIYQKSDLKSDRTQLLSDHTYPFTWDFEHMDICGLDSIAKDAKENGGTYWREAHPYDGLVWNKKVKTNGYWQYNGAFNADWDDKDNNYDQVGYDDEGNKVTGSRQRWFKDIKASGKYMDMFKGLRINLAGLDYWQQKYQRFYVSQQPEGGIFFVGGVSYMSLPGFGINGQNIIIDGTREAGTVNMPNSQIHFDTDGNNCTQAYFESGYGKNGSAYSHDNVMDRYTSKRNHKVYFVIKAKGNSAEESVIFLGGRKMMEKTNTNSTTVDEKGTGTAIGENGTRWSRNEDQPDCYRIPLTTSADVHVVEMDPWDDDFQDQIYLTFDHGVHIYWMAITTEPRDLRADYGCYTYSYPVDLDMEKTNQVMDILTQKQYGTSVNMVPYYGKGYDHTQKQLVIDNLLPEALTETEYKIPANEGLMFYPTVDISGIAGLPTKTIENKTVLRAKVDGQGNPIFNADGTAYAFETVTGDYTYKYLPTFYIANAQNMKKADYAANRGGRGAATLLNAEMEEDQYVAKKDLTLVDADNNVVTKTNVPTYAAENRLTNSTYSTYIFKDYYGKTGAMPTGSTNVAGGNTDYHWIPLGITNEYIRRYLTWDGDGDYKVLTDYLYGVTKDGQGLTPGDPNTTANDASQGEFDEVDTKQYYYNLIGPGVVRYYRANNDNWMKGRRAYLKLTWQEYQINTYGKVINGGSALSGSTTYEEWGTGTESQNTASLMNAESNTNSANLTGVRVRFAKNKTNDDAIVSDDGGLVDGVKEVVSENESVDDGMYYNLNGVRVTTPAKGIYIHNGKKVIVK